VLLTSCKQEEIQKILPSDRKDVRSLNVIIEMVSVQRATIELWIHLGGLPSTQEASASFVLSNLYPFPTRLPFLKYITPNFNPFPMTGVTLISIRLRKDC